MSEVTVGTNPTSSALVTVKRKRGRPRKHPKLDRDRAWGSLASKAHIANHGESSHVPPGFLGINRKQPRKVDSVKDATDFMVGQRVHGVIEAVFDAGYLLTVRVGNSGTTLRGVVFKAGRYVPVSADNDVAPGVEMIRRNEIPLPRENHARVHTHNSRARDRNETVHAARVANPLASEGKQVASVGTGVLSPGISRGNVVPVVLQPVNISNGATGKFSSVAMQPDHAVAGKGKEVLDDVYPSNGSPPLNQFQTESNHQITPSGMQNVVGSEQSLLEAEAKATKLADMPFEKLLAEVIKRNQAPTQSIETDTSSSGKLSADDVHDSDQALSVEPLQAVQPDLHNHPAILRTPLEHYRNVKMTELLQVLQENMTINQAAHPEDAYPDPRSELDDLRNQEQKDGDEDGGHSNKGHGEQVSDTAVHQMFP